MNAASAPQRSDLAARTERFVDVVSRSQALSIALILAVSLLCLVPGFTTIPPIDGDDSAYAVAAREMVATGDYATVRLQTADAEWNPRGSYWLQAFTAGLAQPEAPIWVHRLPSLAGAIAATLLTWWTMLAFGRPRAALLAGLLIAAAGIVGFVARLATPDAILLAALMLAFGALARIWHRAGERSDDLVAMLFWTGLGVGLLAKGIVAPAILLVAIIVLAIERGGLTWLRGLKPAVGIFWFLLIVSPWLISLVLTWMQGSGEGPNADFLTRVGVPFELSAPPGTYALLFPLLVGPAATYIFIALRWIVDDLRRPVVFFSLAAGFPLWLGAELVSAKMPQTILPAVPFVAMLAAAAIDLGTARIRGRISWFYSLGPAIWPPLTAIAVPVLYAVLEGTFPVVAFLSFLVAAVLGPVTWIWLNRGHVIASAFMAVATVIFIYVGFFGAIVPGLTALRVADSVAAVPMPCPAPSYAVAGHPEESMVFVLGRGTRIVDGWGAADFLASAGCRVAVVDSSVIASFRQRTEDIGLPVRDHARVEGINLRKMRAVDVHLFMAEPGATRAR